MKKKNTPSLRRSAATEAIYEHLGSFKMVTTLFILFLTLLAIPSHAAPQAIDAEQVNRSIKKGLDYLKSAQAAGGTWGQNFTVGYTALVALALSTAGESPQSPALSKALRYLRTANGHQNWTYEISLQTMALATATPKLDSALIRNNVDALVKAQGRRGTWDYQGGRDGDNSNTQFALLALFTADEAGIRIPPETFLRARKHWESTQNQDGGWPYQGNYGSASYGSMTAAGIASLIITGVKGHKSLETLEDDEIKQCGKEEINRALENALRWMGAKFSVSANPGSNGWLYYYLYALERAGRLTGRRYFGTHDWYEEGARFLLSAQAPDGSWSDSGEDAILATSYAVLFLAKGKSPVLINKLVHGPEGDWHLDMDDARNLVTRMSQVWKHLLVWQTVDPATQSLNALEQAPIALLNGHAAPILSQEAKDKIKQYVDGGGFLLVDACCSRPEFDAGFRKLIKEIFPEEGSELRPIPPDHEVWRIRNDIDPSSYPLWGVQRACRTSVIYSPQDLSCYWNQLQKNPRHPSVKDALKLGENIIAYATGDTPPPDKLTVKPVETIKETMSKRGVLQIAKLRHGGDWDLAPNAVPNLMRHLSAHKLVPVITSQKEIFASDPNLIFFPLAYMHGKRDFQLNEQEIEGLKKHLKQGGGTLFADALCGSEEFDKGFRRMIAKVFPDTPLAPIQTTHELFHLAGGHDLSTVQYSEMEGNKHKTGFPQLEGIEFNGHYAVIYSKLDLGCALQKTPSWKGYIHESALDIACNIVRYSMLP